MNINKVNLFIIAIKFKNNFLMNLNHVFKKLKIINISNIIFILFILLNV